MITAMRWWAVGLFSLSVAAIQPVAAQQSAAKKPFVPTEMGDFAVKDDKYSPTISVEPKRATQRRNGRDTQAYALYGRVDRKTGAVTFGLQWGEIYSAKTWRYYAKASNSKGDALPFQQLSRSVVGCGGSSCFFEESYNIAFTIEQISEAEKTGLDFKIYGRESDSRIVTVPAAAVGECVGKLTEIEKQRPTQ